MRTPNQSEGVRRIASVIPRSSMQQVAPASVSRLGFRRARLPNTLSPGIPTRRAISGSLAFQQAALSMEPICGFLPAEFGRCGCYLDGIQTSCDVVDACLNAGFCVLA